MAPWVPFSRIKSLAVVTFTELVRSKVFYIVAIFGLIVLGSGSMLAQLTFQEELKILKDVALGSMDIFTTLLAVAATAMLIPNDVEDRTLYTILAKPVTRLEYMLGKLGGVFLLIGALTVIMSVLSCAVLSFRQWQVIQSVTQDMGGAPPEMLQAQLDLIKGQVFTPSFFMGMVLIYVKSCVLATICLAISTITTSTIFTILCTAAVYFIGHVQAPAREYWASKSEVTGQSSFVQDTFIGAIAILFPDWQVYNLSDQINAGNELPLPIFFMTTGWGVFFIMLYVIVGYVIFSKKEL